MGEPVRERICKACAEPMPAHEKRCPHCGESQGMSTGVIVLIVVVALAFLGCGPLALIAAIAVPNLIEARKHGNEAAAIGALKTISTAQSLFREADKENDGVLDYGTLGELGDTMLVDGVLASGTKQGYVFAAQPGSEAPEFIWMATASPAVPGTTGDRYFAVNHEGVVFYRTDASFQITPDASVPQDDPAVSPVGFGRRR